MTPLVEPNQCNMFLLWPLSQLVSNYCWKEHRLAGTVVKYYVMVTQ